jgi:hypothetical protein
VSTRRKFLVPNVSTVILVSIARHPSRRTSNRLRPSNLRERTDRRRRFRARRPTVVAAIDDPIGASAAVDDAPLVGYPAC